MLSLEKINAMKRIKQEFEDLNKNPIVNIGASIILVDVDNIFEWESTLLGPKDTSYSGGLFYLSIKFPNNYPQTAPEVCFKNPIYHVNVNPHKPKFPGDHSLGHVCFSTLNWWKPEYTIREVLIDIFVLLYLGNPDTPYGIERINEFRNNRPLFEKKIKYFTKKYANPLKGRKNYDSDWDFTFKE